MGRLKNRNFTHTIIGLKLFMLVCLLWVCLVLVFGFQRAKAISPYDIPDTTPPSAVPAPPYGGSFKSIFYQSIVEYNNHFRQYPPPAGANYPAGCQQNGNKYHFLGWISKAGEPKVFHSITVPYGTTEVPLWFQGLIFVCHQYVDEYSPPVHPFLSVPAGLPPQGRVTSAAVSFASTAISSSSVYSPNGAWGSLNPSPNGTTLFKYYNRDIRYWFTSASASFTWKAAAPLTQSQDITVTLNAHEVMHWNGGLKQCVANGAIASGSQWAYNCPASPASFNIRINVGARPMQLSCGNVTTNPSTPEPGQNFTATVSVNYSGGTPSQPGQTMSLNVGGFYSNANAAYATSGGVASFTTPTLNRPNPGQHNVTWSLSGGGANSGSCTDTITVAAKPYLRVYGGDVLAGSGFGSACTPTDNAEILAFNSGSGIGAGAQYGVQSIGSITEFGSALTRNQPPEPDIGLTFANTGGGFGGNFGVENICAKDYFSDVSGSNVHNPGATIGGAATVPGTSSADTYDSVDNGRRVILKRDGDVVINGNIAYAGDGSWTDISQIPSLYLIVRGNIYIARGVTRLDGVFIAQPTEDDPDTTGRIYTCTQNDGDPINADNLYDRCRTKLTISGAFVAKQVKFLRTRGTLRNSTNIETSGSCNCAEVFVYSPELWLINPGLTPIDLNPYDSITSLPPVL